MAAQSIQRSGHENNKEGTTVPKILIVDDDPAMRLLLHRALERENYQLIDASNGAEAITRCQQYFPDLVLMDAVMPVMDGFEACRNLQELGTDIPVLIMTALDDEAAVERAFAEGAHDFIPKPIHWALLRQRVIRLIHDSKSEKYIAHLAYHDALTGLPNRQLFMDRFGASLSRARRSDEVVALMFIDLDRFKQINDTLGHNIGDDVLCQIAERLVAGIREGDTVARLGGDEFTILLEGIRSTKNVATIAEKLVTILAEPIIVEQREIPTTASIGIAVYPNDGDDISSLMQHADSAMYRVKQSGRKSYQFYAKEMTEVALRRSLLSNSLTQALAKDEFRLYYQPRSRLRDGSLTIVGMEALVRWHHPDLGIIYPDEFISLAEEIGLIVDFGDWILQQACQQAVNWAERYQHSLCITVNLSELQLKQRNLYQIVNDTLQKTGLAPEQLEFDLPESAFLDSVNSAIEVVNSIHELGVRFALDGFGTGYSSLTQLKKLPLETIKIDRTLIRDIPFDRDAIGIVKAIIAIADSFGLKIVAEGVETKAQLDFLRQLGCQEIQGYIITQPQLPQDINFESLEIDETALS